MYDLIVIGGGPAGYLGAERAARAGMKVALFEQSAVGGVCLNEGCIPSKALLNSAKMYETALHGAPYGVHVEGARLDHQEVIARRGKVVNTLVGGVAAKLRSAGVEVFACEAVIEGRAEGGYAVSSGGETYIARNLLIATGASAIVPPIPGVKEGLEAGLVVTNREVLTLKEVPKELVIVGGGVIGLEMASYYNTAGSHVTVVEMLDHIAGPTDRELSDRLMKEYAAKGIAFLLNAKVVGVTTNAVLAETGGNRAELPADKVLLSIGRRANVHGVGLEHIGVEVNRAGIAVDRQMRTNQPNVYAAGDVTGQMMLAHTAYREAEVAVNVMLGKRDVMRYNANPAVIYTNPEVASVGLTEEEARAAGLPYEVKKLSMRYSGRFVAEHEKEDGLCKLLVHKAKRTVIGVHMLGGYVSEIIWGAAAMIEMEMRVRDAREIIFPHPTVSEIVREALWEFED